MTGTFDSTAASDEPTATFYATMPSPVGELLLTALRTGLTGVYLPGVGGVRIEDTVRHEAPVGWGY